VICTSTLGHIADTSNAPFPTINMADMANNAQRYPPLFPSQQAFLAQLAVHDESSLPPDVQECSICMARVPDDFDILIAIHDSHLFCLFCAHKWILDNPNCPMCRQDLYERKREPGWAASGLHDIYHAFGFLVAGGYPDHLDVGDLLRITDAKLVEFLEWARELPVGDVRETEDDFENGFEDELEKDEVIAKMQDLRWDLLRVDVLRDVVPTAEYVAHHAQKPWDPSRLPLPQRTAIHAATLQVCFDQVYVWDLARFSWAQRSLAGSTGEGQHEEAAAQPLANDPVPPADPADKWQHKEAEGKHEDAGAQHEEAATQHEDAEAQPEEEAEAQHEEAMTQPLTPHPLLCGLLEHLDAEAASWECKEQVFSYQQLSDAVERACEDFFDSYAAGDRSKIPRGAERVARDLAWAAGYAHSREYPIRLFLWGGGVGYRRACSG
jgi:hypothetical protein